MIEAEVEIISCQIMVSLLQTLSSSQRTTLGDLLEITLLQGKGHDFFVVSCLSRLGALSCIDFLIATRIIDLPRAVSRRDLSIFVITYSLTNLEMPYGVH